MAESKPRSRPRLQDIAIVGGPTDDGQGARVLRIRDGNLSAGEIRPLREGETITHSEVVRLRPVDGEPRVCEVEVLHEPPKPPAGAGAGAGQGQSPARRARVSTASYRKNWDTVFDSKKKRSKADNWSVN